MDELAGITNYEIYKEYMEMFNQEDVDVTIPKRITSTLFGLIQYVIEFDKNRALDFLEFVKAAESIAK
jgi:hypothetical protein